MDLKSSLRPPFLVSSLSFFGIGILVVIAQSVHVNILGGERYNQGLQSIYVECRIDIEPDYEKMPIGRNRSSDNVDVIEINRSVNMIVSINRIDFEACFQSSVTVPCPHVRSECGLLWNYRSRISDKHYQDRFGCWVDEKQRPSLTDAG